MTAGTFLLSHRYRPGNSTEWKQHAFGMEVALLERLLASHVRAAPSSPTTSISPAPPLHLPWHLRFISPASPLHLPCISPSSPLHLPCISPSSPLSSPQVRVAEPELADYFYVPVWGGCWLSRFSRPTPWHHDLGGSRVPRAARASAVYLRAYEHIMRRYPYWNRTGGADHIFTFPHDEGACLAPREIARCVSAGSTSENLPRTFRDREVRLGEIHFVSRRGCLMTAGTFLHRAVLVSHWGRTTAAPPNHTTISHGQGWHVAPWFRSMCAARSLAHIVSRRGWLSLSARLTQYLGEVDLVSRRG